MKAKPLITGLATYIPGVYKRFAKPQTGGTCAATYCYDVWFKHLTMLRASGMRSIPRTLAELGPGDSLGVGIAALLSGVEHYYALDVVRFANVARNLAILDELVTLFQAHAPRPTRGWPDFDQYLDQSLFPSHILTDAVLHAGLAPERIAAIRASISDPDDPHTRQMIHYVVPWDDPHVIVNGSIDLIISHSVLEHINDLEKTYQACSWWLKPQGWMSHQIDFRSHGLTKAWNGHWATPELLWKIVVGKRTYLINRQPCARHLALLREHGFDIVRQMSYQRTDGITRRQLARQWKDLSDEDLHCAGLFVQARKA